MPTFLVIGAMRAGTTTLWHQLRSHPDVFMPDLKEPSYFASHFNWNRGAEWYGNLFSNADGRVAIGEASTCYSDIDADRRMPARMARMLPGVRLIYLLRHPIDRLVSEYYYRAPNGDRLPIDTALRQRNYLTKSMYASQVDGYLRYFDRHQLLLITSDELWEDPAATLRRVFAFIGVDPTWQPSDLGNVFNARGQQWTFTAARTPGGIDPWSETLSPAVRRELVDRLRPDLRRLQALFDEPFDCWSLLEPSTDGVVAPERPLRPSPRGAGQ